METILETKVVPIIQKACKLKIENQSDILQDLKGIDFAEELVAKMFEQYYKDERLKCSISEISKSVIMENLSINHLDEIIMRCDSERLVDSVAKALIIRDELFNKIYSDFARNVKFAQKVDSSIPDLSKPFEMEYLKPFISEKKLAEFEYSIRTVIYFVKVHELSNESAIVATKKHISSLFGNDTMKKLLEAKNPRLYFAFEYIFKYNIYENWSKFGMQCLYMSLRDILAFIKENLKPDIS